LTDEALTINEVEMNISSELELLFFGLAGLLTFGFALLRVTISVVEKRARALWRLEAKIDLLLKVAAIEFDPYQNLPREVMTAMALGERVRAMKYYQEASGASLKEAVDFIDEAQRHRKSAVAG
jgi:hypothetical protein